MIRKIDDQEDCSGRLFRKIVQEDCSGRLFRKIDQEDCSGRLMISVFSQ